MTAARAALWYTGTICLLYGALPALTFPGAPLDVVEGFAWGRELQLGYTKHPPMAAWLLEATYHLSFGHYFGGYILSALCAAIGYLCIWHLARRLGFSQWQGFWAIVLTSATFYFTLPMPEFNPNILQIPVWAGMMLLFHKALEKGHWRDWLLLGALAAFGLHAKYFVALLIGTIGLYTLVFADARRRLLTLGPWLSASVCVVLLLPHIGWLIETDLLTLHYAADRSKPAVSLSAHLFNPLNFLVAQIGNHAGLFIIVLAGLGWHGIRTFAPRRRASAPALPMSLSHANDRFLLWFAFLPLAVVVLASAVTGNEFEHMWGTPMFVLSGLIAVRYLHLPDLWPFPRRAAAAGIAIQTIFLGVLFGQAVLEPYWKTKQTRLHYPGPEVASHLVSVWQERMGTNLAYVAGDMWSAANVTLFAPGRPSMFYLHDLTLSPWIDINDVQDKGLMMVWRGDRKVPLNELLPYYPDAIRDGTVAIPFEYGDNMPDVILNWLIIPPGEVALRRPE